MKVIRNKHHNSFEIVGIRCDRCGFDTRLFRSLADQFEFYEYRCVDFTAGYGGEAFLDGDRHFCDLCQYCLKAVLGPFLKRIEAD